VDERMPARIDLPGFDAIVLAGGRATRLGGVDKPGIVLGGQSLLERVLAAVADAERLVVVGPSRALPVGILQCREQPPGTGPLAALAAGLPFTTAPVVLVLGADLPWVAPAMPVLRGALPPTAGRPPDAVALADSTGRLNLLAAAWHRSALIAALRRIGDPTGRPMHALTDHAEVTTVPDAAAWGADCDTPRDVELAARRLAEGSDVR
jgi:molybdopterin-guanine dinucleotide biosynthesis protein A